PARRSRHRHRLAATAAAVALVALTTMTLPLVRTPALEPAAGSPAALPDRVALPPIGTLHVTDRPLLGPAAVLFSGVAGRLKGWNDANRVGVVGADSDRYRIMPMGYEAPAGEVVLLSPDGRYVARPAGSHERPRVDIVDLATGRTRQLNGGPAASTSIEPAAWSPDGRQLVVRYIAPTDPPRAGHRAVLGVVTLDGERWTRLAEGGLQAIFGSPVAFTAAGDRIAFQVGRSVTVSKPDGTALSSLLLPADSWLAGKGAWSADGRWLTVTTRRADNTDWSLRRLDPATGRDAGPLDLPTVSGTTAIRLLGWGPDGSALVVAYEPGPVAQDRFDQPLEMDQRTAYGNVGGVQVLALMPGATGPRTVLTAPAEVLAVDVADEVIRSGRTRQASPPGGVGGRFWFWTTLTVVVWAGIAVYRCRENLALWLDDRRVRRARATAERSG
ncbi:PD40 domain-containing protein, partial [Micromonospora phaseoli]|uniref:PD40 domain-containing protein n=1 Tax=Micromonospora phaseoli TaxID=1144548 RepID=UPI00194EB381